MSGSRTRCCRSRIRRWRGVTGDSPLHMLACAETPRRASHAGVQQPRSRSERRLCAGASSGVPFGVSDRPRSTMSHVDVPARGAACCLLDLGECWSVCNRTDLQYNVQFTSTLRYTAPRALDLLTRPRIRDNLVPSGQNRSIWGCKAPQWKVAKKSDKGPAYVPAKSILS